MKELVKAGIISQNDLEKAKTLQKHRGGSLGEILVEMNAVDVNKFINYIQQL